MLHLRDGSEGLAQIKGSGKLPQSSGTLFGEIKHLSESLPHDVGALRLQKEDQLALIEIPNNAHWRLRSLWW